MKILHGPVNVGNQPWVLSRAERRLGATSYLTTRSETWLKYPADQVLTAQGDQAIKVAARSFAYGLTRQWYYDVFHFYFGQTFFLPGFPLFENPLLDNFVGSISTIDLRLARSMGKKLFMTLQGCDARLAQDGNNRNKWTMCASHHCEMYQRCVDVLDDRRRYLIEKVLPLFNRVFYLNPELGHVVPDGQFLPYSNVEIKNFEVVPPSKKARPKIVHAPSSGRIKGTRMILDALERLRGRFDFELILIEKKTHSEALELYRLADIAIDQVLAGWYGGFAVEMMAMGKPVACYLRDTDMVFVPEAMQRELPILKLDPDNLVEDIASLLDRRSEWEAVGRASRKFVERWHNPDLIAKAMLRAYVERESRFEFSPDAD